MHFSLSSLPTEIINLHILPLLDVDDIISLSHCVRVDISRSVYNRVFHEDTHFDHYDIQMFQERAECQLYFFGVTNPGHPVTDIGPWLYYENVGKDRRMCMPRKIETGMQTIADISVGSFWLQIRNSHGMLSNVMLGEQEGQEYPSLFPKKLKSRGTLDEKVKTTPNTLTAASEMFINRSLRPAKFIDMAAGMVFAAVDESGLLWVFTRNFMQGNGVPVLLLDEQGQSLKGDIVKIRAEMFGFLCQIEDKGIMSFGDFEEGYAPADSYRNGYPCIQGHFWSCRVCTVWEATDNIKDFVSFGGFFVCLMRNGMIQVRSSEDPSHTLNTDEVNKSGPFVQLCAVYFSAAIVTTDGRVLLLKTHREFVGGFVQTILDVTHVPGLGDIDVASVAASSRHCLILTQDGDVYSWGSELLANGCLGLGRIEDAVKLKGVTHDNGGSLKVDRPTKIKLPGKAYAVYAHENYSAVLVYRKNMT